MDLALPVRCPPEAPLHTVCLPTPPLHGHHGNKGPRVPVHQSQFLTSRAVLITLPDPVSSSRSCGIHHPLRYLPTGRHAPLLEHCQGQAAHSPPGPDHSQASLNCGRSLPSVALKPVSPLCLSASSSMISVVTASALSPLLFRFSLPHSFCFLMFLMPPLGLCNSIASLHELFSFWVCYQLSESLLSQVEIPKRGNWSG